MKNAMAVFVGGVIGGLGRGLCDRWLGGPVATLLVNLTGAFVLGYWTARWIRRGRAGSWLNLAVGTGVIGAWTTFSTMTTTTVTMLAQSPFRGLGYITVMVGGGLALAGLGRVIIQGRQS